MTKYLSFLIILSSCFSLFSQNHVIDVKNTPHSPIDLVQQQLDAYNLRDIEAFLEPYDENVEAYLYPSNKIAYQGKEAMRKIYSKLFNNTPNLYCKLINRIVQGNTVIDKERVQFGNDTIEAVAIYHIENKKIKKIHFIN